MKDYLVWYRLAGSKEDIIRGVARNCKRAEQMAEALDLYLKSKNIPVIATGVKTGYHGKLYEDANMHMRWSVIPSDIPEIK
jgi:hypothetical protein